MASLSGASAGSIREQAAIVRRIFAEYAAGSSPKAIARALNREKVSGPRGRDWAASTIHGQRRRGNGVLNNELYIGRIVWNRLRFVKDPETGRRVAWFNPESARITCDVPELRIIDQALWEKVKARQGAMEAGIIGRRSQDRGPSPPALSLLRAAQVRLMRRRLCQILA